MKECPYTDERRDALENTPPSALEISLRRGFCTPRPSRLPSGFALGQSLGPRGAKSPPSGNLLGLGGCIFQYIPPLVSVRTHSVSLCRSKSYEQRDCVEQLGMAMRMRPCQMMRISGYADTCRQTKSDVGSFFTHFCQNWAKISKKKK